jgi:hypothetical protein
MAEKPRNPGLSLVTPLSVELLSPPRPLGPAGQALWDRIQREYGISDAGGVELLLLACEATDRGARLRAGIDADGEVIHTRSGVPRAHPALRDEVAARAQVMRALKELGLNYEAIKMPGGQPRSTGWTGER